MGAAEPHVPPWRIVILSHSALRAPRWMKGSRMTPNLFNLPQGFWGRWARFTSPVGALRVGQV
jgi:hypothetical protein